MATAYEKVQLARGKGRPSGLSFIQNIFPDFIELFKIIHGFLPRHAKPAPVPCPMPTDSRSHQIIVAGIQVLLCNRTEATPQKAHHRFIAVITGYNFKRCTDKLDKRMKQYFLCGIHKIWNLIFGKQWINITLICLNRACHNRDLTVAVSLPYQTVNFPCNKRKLILRGTHRCKVYLFNFFVHFFVWSSKKILFKKCQCRRVTKSFFVTVRQYDRF